MIFRIALVVCWFIAFYFSFLLVSRLRYKQDIQIYHFVFLAGSWTAVVGYYLGIW